MENKINYLKYLLSEEWKEKRRLKIWHNNICERCKEEKSTQVHHLNYNNLGNEKEEDLLAVCNRCHILLEIKKINIEEYNKIIKEIEEKEYFNESYSLHCKNYEKMQEELNKLFPDKQNEN